MRARLLLSGLSVCGVLVVAGCKHHEAKPTAPLPCVNVEDCPSGKAGVLATVPPSASSPISRVMGEAKPLASPSPTVASIPTVEPTNRPRDLFVSGIVRPLPEATPAIIVPPVEAPAPRAMPATIVPPTETIPATANTPTPSAVVSTEARSRLEHAPDFRWLVGEVTYSSAKKEWRLRYAELGESDDFGGSVTLTGSGHWFEKLRDGQRVRVEGELLTRTPRIAPSYRVTLLRSAE